MLQWHKIADGKLPPYDEAVLVCVAGDASVYIACRTKTDAEGEHWEEQCEHLSLGDCEPHQLKGITHWAELAALPPVPDADP